MAAAEPACLPYLDPRKCLGSCHTESRGVGQKQPHQMYQTPWEIWTASLPNVPSNARTFKSYAFKFR
jgi:hypothetical protein